MKKHQQVLERELLAKCYGIHNCLVIYNCRYKFEKLIYLFQEANYNAIYSRFDNPLKEQLNLKDFIDLLNVIPNQTPSEFKGFIISNQQIPLVTFVTTLSGKNISFTLSLKENDHSIYGFSVNNTTNKYE